MNIVRVLSSTKPPLQPLIGSSHGTSHPLDDPNNSNSVQRTLQYLNLDCLIWTRAQLSIFSPYLAMSLYVLGRHLNKYYHATVNILIWKLFDYILDNHILQSVT